MQRIYLNMGHRVTVSWAWRNPMVTPALTQGNPLTDTWIEIFFFKKKRFYVQNLAMWNRPFELPKNSINLGFRTSIHCPVILFSKGLRVSRKSSSDLGGFQNIAGVTLRCSLYYETRHAVHAKSFGPVSRSRLDPYQPWNGRNRVWSDLWDREEDGTEDCQ
jgi:hypothetical protein